MKHRKIPITSSDESTMGSSHTTEPFEVPEYDEASFLAKVKRVLVQVGKTGLEKLFLAYYVMKDPGTPMRDKSLLAGSLAYFVLPFDAIPDWIIGLGYTDDLALLTTALISVAASVRPEHHDLAKQSLARVVGSAPEPE